MEEQPSGELSEVHRTALSSAAVRALHLLADGEPKLLEDHFALALSGWGEDEVLQAAEEGRLSRGTGAWVLRSRFAEDLLQHRRAAGVRQYVVLGAGLDSYALRCPGDVDVYEVDDPPMVEWKRRRLEALGIATPGTLHPVPCDFETTPLDAALAAGGFDASARTFVSWLGVTEYLSAPAVEGTLRWAASLDGGCEMVLSYMDKTAYRRAAARRAAATPEGAEGPGAAGATPAAPHLRRSPIVRSLFTRGEVRAMLKRSGMGDFRFVSPEELDFRYCRGRSDGMRANRGELLTVARPARCSAPEWPGPRWPGAAGDLPLPALEDLEHDAGDGEPVADAAHRDEVAGARAAALE